MERTTAQMRKCIVAETFNDGSVRIESKLRHRPLEDVKETKYFNVKCMRVWNENEVNFLVLN